MAKSDLTMIDVVSPFMVDVVVNKLNYKDHFNTKIASEEIRNDGVLSETIPIDLSGFKHLRSIEVAPATKVRTHAHNSPIVRFITRGDATVNGVVYKAGDWMIIPRKFPYSISTDEGYSAIGFCHLWSDDGPEPP